MKNFLKKLGMTLEYLIIYIFTIAFSPLIILLVLYTWIAYHISCYKFNAERKLYEDCPDYIEVE